MHRLAQNLNNQKYSRFNSSQLVKGASMGMAVLCVYQATFHESRAYALSSVDQNAEYTKIDQNYNHSMYQNTQIAFPGGGIYFWWQIGCAKYLQENYELSNVQFIGASAGALVATLTKCGVQPERALESAHRLCEEENVWDRKLGLLGVWGGIVERWLQELLPSNASELCRGNLKIIATKVPQWDVQPVQNFQDRDDLIGALMASVHLPFLIDFKPATRYRGSWFLDGSIQDLLTSSIHPLLVENSVLTIDPNQDKELEQTYADFVKLRDLDQVKELMMQGYRYAAKIDGEGQLSQLPKKGAGGGADDVSKGPKKR